MSFVVRALVKGNHVTVSAEFSSPKFWADYIQLAIKSGLYSRNDLSIAVKQGRKLINYQKILEGGVSQ